MLRISNFGVGDLHGIGANKIRIMPPFNVIGYRLQRPLDDTQLCISGSIYESPQAAAQAYLIRCTSLTAHDKAVAVASLWLVVALAIPKG